MKEFVKTDVAPELIASLANNKSMIIDAAIIAAEEMAQSLATAMSQSLAEKLGNSYRRGVLIKALFD